MGAVGPIRDINGNIVSKPWMGDPSPVQTLLTTGNFDPNQTFQQIDDGGVTSFMDNLIKAGAITGATIAMPGVGTSMFGGAATPGLGAEAIGGSGIAEGAGAGAASVAPSAGGLASQFSGGQYVDPLFSGTPEAGVPGATGTFNAAAPLTGNTLATGINPVSGGLSLQDLKNIKNGVNTGRTIGNIFGGGQQPQTGGGSNLGQLLAAGGLGALLGSGLLGGSSPPATTSTGGSQTTLPGQGAAPSAPVNLPPPPSWNDFMSRVGATQANADPQMAAMLGLQPNDIAMRSLGVPAAGYAPSYPPGAGTPPTVGAVSGGLNAGAGAVPRLLGPPQRPPAAMPPRFLGPPTQMAKGGVVTNPNPATNPFFLPGAGEQEQQTDPQTNLAKLSTMLKDFDKSTSPTMTGGFGASDVASRIAQLTSGLQPHVMRGGLGYARGGYAGGASGGQADAIPAKLSSGEYVMDADVVSALGDGNNEAGARKLDSMRERVRAHKRSAPPDKIPPAAKEPMAYLGKRK
jgi:hypothetical protein